MPHSSERFNGWDLMPPSQWACQCVMAGGVAEGSFAAGAGRVATLMILISITQISENRENQARIGSRRDGLKAQRRGRHFGRL